MRWGRKRKVKIKWRKGQRRERGLRGKESKSICSGTDHQTAGGQPGIGLPGGFSPTHPRGSDPWDMWGSWRCDPPCGSLRGNLGMLDHRPCLRSGCRTGASSSSQIWAGRGHFGKTEAAVVRLGLLEGEWTRAICWVTKTGRSHQSSGLVEGVWPGSKHPFSARNQRWEEERFGRDLLYSLASKDTMLRDLERSPEGAEVGGREGGDKRTGGALVGGR